MYRPIVYLTTAQTYSTLQPRRLLPCVKISTK